MWTRRIDLNIAEPMTNGFPLQRGLKLFQDRIRCMPQAAARSETERSGKS